MKTLKPIRSAKNKYYIYEEDDKIAVLFRRELLGIGKHDEVRVYGALLTTLESMETKYIAVKIIHCLSDKKHYTDRESQDNQIEKNNRIIEFYNSLPNTDEKRSLIAPYDVLKLDHIDKYGREKYYVFVLMPICQTKDFLQVLRDLCRGDGEGSNEMEALKSQSLQSEWFPMLLNILLWLHSMGLPHRDIKVENIAVATDGSWVELFDLEYLVLPSSKHSCTPGSIPSSHYILIMSGLWATKLNDQQRRMIHIHGDLFALSMILCRIFFPRKYESSYVEDLEYLNLIISAFKRNNHYHPDIFNLISQQNSERFILIQLLITEIEARTQHTQPDNEELITHSQLILSLLQMVSVNEDILCHFVANLALTIHSRTDQHETPIFELQQMDYHPPDTTEETKEEEEEKEEEVEVEVEEEEEEEKTIATPLTHIRLFPPTRKEDQQEEENMPHAPEIKIPKGQQSCRANLHTMPSPNS